MAAPCKVTVRAVNSSLVVECENVECRFIHHVGADTTPERLAEVADEHRRGE